MQPIAPIQALHAILMTVTLQHNDLTIELFDDSAFNQTADSPISYDKVIQADKDKEYSPTSQHAIKIYRDNNLISSAIILATGGGTGIHSDSALIVACSFCPPYEELPKLPPLFCWSQ